MPVIMMTSIDTLYEVTAQDTQPIQKLGAPNIESSFNGLTQMVLQSPSERIQNREQTEAAFKQQQKYLNDAAQVAVNIFNPIITDGHRFRATLKLTAITGNLQAFDIDSESSGLAYTIALALNWGNKKGLFNHANIPDIPIFATGCVPIDGYAKPIGHLLKKIRYACDYIEQKTTPNSQHSSPSFYVLIPQGNIEEYEKDKELNHRVVSLGGAVKGIKHLSEALQLIMGEAFDGGIFTNINNGFAGLQSISYEQRHLFMGREQLIKELYEKSQMALEQAYILNVSGVSGSGKSSAVMAGLIPTLLSPPLLSTESPDRLFSPDWKLVRPSQFLDIDTLLAECLRCFTTDKEIITQWLALKNNAQKMGHEILTFLQKNNSSKNMQEARALWVIDQYEEIFNHHQISISDAQKLFPLLSALSEQLPILIITVLRTEYIGLLGGQASIDVQLPRRIQPREIEHIISLQLQYHRLSTESALTSDQHIERRQHLEHRIKNDAIGKPLTTVSYLLQQMHHQMILEDASSTLLTHQHYEAVNGINGVMAQQAELAITEGLSDYPEHQHNNILHGFFEAFIGIDTELQPIAKTLENKHINDYPKAVNTLINAFMSKGLIIDCGRGKTPKIKLAHDTLLPSIPHTSDQPHWERLLQWFNKHQQFLLWRRDTDPLFFKWQSLGHHSKEYLLTHKPTLKAAKKQHILAISTNQSLRHYLQTSLSARIKKQLYPCLAILAICFISGLSIWNQYFRIKTEHVSFIGDRYGIPFGVTPLTTQQKSIQQFHYQLRYQGKKLLSLSRHNSHGSLKNDVNKDNAARWNYSYTATGTLLQEESFAQNGKPLISKTYEFTPDKNIAQVRFKFHGTHKTIGDIAYQAAQFEGKSKNKSQITQHRLEFNHEGFITKRLFFNSNEQAVKDATGAYGLHYGYTQQGLISRLQYIGMDGESLSINGVHSREYKRTATGNIASKSWLDKSGNLTSNQQGYARTTTIYDTNGNLLEKSYLAGNDHLTVHKDGFSRATAKYDKKGNQIEQQFLDKQGNATLHKWGFAKVALKYDERGNAIEWQYFDEHNKPTLRNNRFSRITFAYDELGNKIEEAYFGLDNKPVLHRNGYARFTAEYDLQGNRLKEAYFGVDDKPTLNKKGYARIRSTYDDKGNQIQRSYFGINNEAVLNQYGYAYYQATYDPQGNRTQVRFYNTDDQLHLNNYGFARIAIEYDDQGNKTEIRYYDTNNKAALHKDGIARTSLRYDHRGNIIEASYYGINDQPTRRNNRFSRITLAYDDRGNRIEERYFDTNKQPIVNSNGYARQTVKHDKRNNPIEWQYFGIDDQPIANKHGFSRIIATYDAQDRLIGSAYFDANNQYIQGKGSLQR